MCKFGKKIAYITMNSANHHADSLHLAYGVRPNVYSCEDHFHVGYTEKLRKKMSRQNRREYFRKKLSKRKFTANFYRRYPPRRRQKQETIILLEQVIDGLLQESGYGPQVCLATNI